MVLATRLFEEKKMKNLTQTREVTYNFIINKYEIISVTSTTYSNIIF